MVVQMKEGILWKITCIVVLLLGLLWGGCSLNDQWEAQAQTDRGVKTYEILQIPLSFNPTRIRP
jgi:hypothetical protein